MASKVAVVELVEKFLPSGLRNDLAEKTLSCNESEDSPIKAVASYWVSS
jgi:hypothetical protein